MAAIPKSNADVFGPKWLKNKKYVCHCPKTKIFFFPDDRFSTAVSNQTKKIVKTFPA